jgi:hypothetical protein
VITAFFEQTDSEILSVSPDDFVAAVLDALES